MKRLPNGIVTWLCTTVCLGLVSSAAAEVENKTVIGPTNPELYEGAQALIAGDGEEGVRLTLLGLRYAHSSRERLTAKSNLCAGYILVDQFDTALTYCDEVIAENNQYWRAYSNRALAYIKLGRLEEAEQDVQRAEELAKNSRNVKTVRSMLLDLTDPVVPEITIDDRRQPADNTDE